MKKYLSGFACISFVLAAISTSLYALAISSPRIADLINGTVSVAIRFILSSITYLLPFSFFELLIILSPFVLILLIVIAVKRAEDRRDMLRGVISLLAAIAIIFTAYIYTLGIGYRTTRLADRLDIEDEADITADELYHTVLEVIDGMNAELSGIKIEQGRSVLPYSIDEMSLRLVRAYDLMNDGYSLLTNFTSRVKPVHFSGVMSDLGIVGIYSFFTGESNVNVEYPDYYLPFTAAHELAHQRGISREDEANFVAFLVCISSDDAYIRYSGYLNMYEYLSSSLYRADRDLYYEAESLLPRVALADTRDAYEVYLKHKDSPLGRINEKLNDAYLKANGTEGVVSYGYVVRLAVGYYKKQNIG